MVRRRAFSSARPVSSSARPGVVMAIVCSGVVLARLDLFIVNVALRAWPTTFTPTGSAVVNMLRQLGLAIGVAVLIAVLGSPGSPAG